MTGPDDAGREAGGPDVGSVSEEAVKLFGALADLARQSQSELGNGLSGLADQAAKAAHQVDEHLATGAPECTFCPVCRAVHAVRQTSPEVRAHLTTAAASLVQAAAGFLATAVPADREPGSGVEHIDLDGDWPEDDQPEGDR